MAYQRVLLYRQTYLLTYCLSINTARGLRERLRFILLACTYRVRPLSQLGSQAVAVTSPGKSMAAAA